MSDFRPISLCNVLIRILSKNQSAFIEGRLLTDNALIAFEINHYIHQKTQGKTGVTGLKIDVSKAYDRASKMEADSMRSILNRYERLSGQAVNYSKSNVVFSPNTSLADRELVSGSLGIAEVSKPGTYLGMPMSIGKNKYEIFGFLTDRVRHKLQ
ncbi:uncharacterized protein LOC141718924 [Apium graveolens]|uniref:uncharacterized protein LOC141718924 n=1 Tax=Apium graveolens TaxID=4045 RepID=UPI003D7A785C